MVERDQCRAARGLLDWKQTDLAAACGISKTAITNFESGLMGPRQATLVKIREAFEREGIEFIGNYGVQRRQDSFKVLQGNDVAIQLWGDIFETLKDKGGEVCVSNVDERAAYNRHPKELLNHLKKLKEHGITERLLVCEKDAFFLQPPECYRWLSRDSYVSGVTTFLYGGKIAIRFWKDPLTLIINHPLLYQEKQKHFDYLWNYAIIPPYADLVIEGPEGLKK